jgi:nitroreductase
MEIPFPRWYEALLTRRSRRLYKPKPPAGQVLERLIAACSEFRPFDTARAVLIRHTEDVFKGIIGAYGKIRGAPFFLAFIGDAGNRYVQDKVGYTGEGIMLEATALGLGACWVGKSFDRRIASSLVTMKKHERVLAVAAVGYAAEETSFEETLLTGFGKLHKRKPVAELVSGMPEAEWPEWIRKALMAARLAPSAVNRQPWRFLVEQDGLTVSVDNLHDSLGISKRLDCGIAMLHIEIAALNCTVTGRWEFLEPPRVAKFVMKD